jgi:hypothetical protein
MASFIARACHPRRPRLVPPQSYLHDLYIPLGGRCLLGVGAGAVNLAILQDPWGACISIPCAVHSLAPADARTIGFARLFASTISAVDFLRNDAGDE